VSEARWRYTTIAHAGRAMLGPVSDATAEAMLARLPPPGPARVLDVGCGKGALLVRALERWGGTGVGIEPNPAFAAEARTRADDRLGPGRARILDSDFTPGMLQAERFDLVICTGALHAFGGWDAALRGIAPLLEPGGHALLGPGYWRQAPEPEYLAATGIGADEMEALGGLITRAEAAGWRALAVHESTAAEWDDYEAAYAASVRGWCDANAADPDAGPFRTRIDRWADAYARWGRDTMGYALVLLAREGA
jgi:cyclopropane fatty-acyl-phospholipid synthase-like methyltransferase